ncbi:MAG: DUF3276 family protein [Spirochaetia bacterium]|jgi:hypothetical protein|nr:DUF3276 family protein [Spirochaetia bacterium]
MGVRGEIFSSKVMCEGRSYFFNVKENRMGDLFLAIVESKPTETETFDRRSIVIFRENLQEFLKSFEKALAAMDKVPMKRPSKRSERHVSDSPSEGSRGSSERGHGPSDRSHSGSSDRRVDRRPTGLPPVPPAPRQRRSDVEGTFSLLPEETSSSGKSSARTTSKPGKRVVRPRSAAAERMVPRPPAEDPDAKPVRRVTVKRAKPKD